MATIKRSQTNLNQLDMDCALGKLAQFQDLVGDDIDFIRRSAKPSERYSPGADLCREGSRLPARAILSGWAARVRFLPDGRRQIFSFLVPGDMVGVQTKNTLRTAVTALTVVQTADLSTLRDAAAASREHGAIAEAFAQAAEMEEVLLLNHIVRLGRQTPCQRVAHLFLELAERLDATMIANECRFALPLTQEHLADALGLSLVHTNRTLQQLRQENLLTFRTGQASLLEVNELCALADFAPGEIWKTATGQSRDQWSPPAHDSASTLVRYC